MHRYIYTPLALIAAASITTASHSQWMSSDGGMSLSIGAGSYLLSSATLKTVTEDSQKKQKTTPKPPAQKASGKTSTQSSASKLTDTRFIRKGGYARSVTTISQIFPANQQAHAQQVYTALLAAYPQVVGQFGASENDLAVGMAAFIAGNYSGYHNQPFPDDKFTPLVEQLRSSMESDPAIARMTNADKQQLNDILAAIGMQMVMTQAELQKTPNATTARQMRIVSQGYLRDVLGVNAANLQMTHMGMII